MDETACSPSEFPLAHSSEQNDRGTTGTAGAAHSNPYPQILMEAMDHVVSVISHTFAFGYYDMDDIRQEARLMCMDAYTRWDHIRPLANFLYSHVHKRLYNLRRNKYMRNDAPCSLCHNGELHENGETCEPYRKWLKINLSKKTLAKSSAHATPLDVNSENKSDKSPQYWLEHSECIEIFDRNIPLELRKDYLKMKEGVIIPKKKLKVLLEKLREIAAEHNLLDDEDSAHE